MVPMRRREMLSPRGFWRACSVLLAVFLLYACGGGVLERDGSETHFLRACGEGCPEGSDCICGVCSLTCTDSGDCAARGARAVCSELAPRVAERRCAPSASKSLCDAECVLDADCGWLGAGFTCGGGFCRDGVQSLEPAQTCAAPPVGSDDLLVMGDSLIELSSFTADLEQAAVAGGALASGQHYKSTASYLMSVLATGSLSIENQYTSARATRIPRAIVLDGGATDVLSGQCTSNQSPSCPAIQAAVRGAEQLLGEFAADGVENVVYFFYADPIGKPDLKASLDVLRPLIENVCGKSRLPCHFLDLRPLFDGHADYVGADGIVFNDTGAQVAANAVFALLRERCVL